MAEPVPPHPGPPLSPPPREIDGEWHSPLLHPEPPTIYRWRLLVEQLVATIGSLRTVLAGRNFCEHASAYGRNCPHCQAADAALKLPIPYEGVLSQAILSAALAGDQKATVAAVQKWKDWHNQARKA